MVMLQLSQIESHIIFIVQHTLVAKCLIPKQIFYHELKIRSTWHVRLVYMRQFSKIYIYITQYSVEHSILNKINFTSD